VGDRILLDVLTLSSGVGQIKGSGVLGLEGLTLQY
jgi:hypothetical protein